MLTRNMNASPTQSILKTYKSEVVIFNSALIELYFLLSCFLFLLGESIEIREPFGPKADYWAQKLDGVLNFFLVLVTEGEESHRHIEAGVSIVFLVKYNVVNIDSRTWLYVFELRESIVILLLNCLQNTVVSV